MIRLFASKLAAASVLALAMTGNLWASYTIEGDAQALTVTAEDADRAELVSAIIDRFELEVEGGAVASGPISGTFSGSLSDVLQSVLDENGYALAYLDGKPVRITFTRHDTGTPMARQVEPKRLESAIAAPPPPTVENAEEADIPTMETIMRDRLQQQVMAEKGNADTPRADQQLSAAEATQQAVRELEILVDSLRNDNH